MTRLTVAQALRVLGGHRAEDLAQAAAAQAADQLGLLRWEWANTRKPYRLRDVRRALSRSIYGGARSALAYQRARQLCVLALHGAVGPTVPYSCGPMDQLRDLDRLISRYGPDWPLDGLIEDALSSESAAELVAEVVAEAERAAPHGKQALEYDAARALYAVAERRVAERRPADPPADPPAERRPADRTDHQVGPEAPISEGPHTQADATTHGGDGNSGDVDHAAETSAADRTASESARPQADAAGDTPDDPSQAGAPGADEADGLGHRGNPPTDAATREGAESPTGQGAPGADEATQGLGTHPRADASPADDTLPGQQRSAQGDGASASADTTADHADAGGDAESPTGLSIARYLTGDPIADARTLRASSRVALAALERIVLRAVGASGNPTPRVDGRALVRELVSRRVALHRARRHEHQLRHLVLAVDESGSCAPTVNALYGLALEVARQLPRDRVSVVLHVNGYALRAGAVCTPAAARIIARYERDLHAPGASHRAQHAATECWRELARRLDVGLLLNLGDSDAYEVLSPLVRAGVPVLSLESEATSEPWRVGPVYDALSAAHTLRRLVGQRR